MLLRKRTVIILAAVSVLITAQAQGTYENSEASYIKSSKYAIGAGRSSASPSGPIISDYPSGYRPAGIGDGWFLSVRGGYSSFVGSPTGCNDFWGRGKFHAAASVGKWLTPYIGLRASYWGYSFMDANNTSRHYGNVHGDILFNISNLLRPVLTVMPRWDVIPYVGFGSIRASSPSESAFSVNPGIDIRYRINSRLYISGDIGASLTRGDWDGEGKKGSCDAILSGSIGLTYNIGGNSWKRRSQSQKGASVSGTEAPAVEYVTRHNDYYGLNRLHERIGISPKEKGDSSFADSSAHRVLATYYLFFKFNSTELTDKGQLINLRAAAALSNKFGYNIEVLTAADSKTGTPKGNRRLARRRARKVRELLQKYDVPKSRIKLYDRGGINIYKPYPLNRQAIVKLYDKSETQH